MKKVNLSHIIIPFVVIVVSILVPNTVNACSCLLESNYFIDKAEKADFIGVVTILDTSEQIEVEQGVATIGQIQIDVQIEMGTSANQNLNTILTREEVLDYPARECRYQCSSYLDATVGANENFQVGDRYFVITTLDGESNEIIASSIKLDESNQLATNFLQFEAGEDLQIVLDYISSQLGIDISFVTSALFSTNTLVYIVSSVVVIILAAFGIYIFYNHRRKTQN